MQLEELLKDSVFRLPITQIQGQPFNKGIKKLLNLFLAKVNSLDDGPIDIPGISIDGSFVKHTQRIIVNGLLDSIDEYYQGFPSRAYDTLDRTLRNSTKDLYSIIKQETYAVSENFYRIRVKEEYFPFDAKDLFHIPFELRGKVSTQRYSIPGFPCLYLGRTIYVCWEELNRPQINKFQAVRFKNTKEITLLDLTPPSRIEAVSKRELYRYFMTWPLIACCCVKVKDYNDTFKPEYIMPQLLLQWVRHNDQIDGIKYKSTHIKSKAYHQDGELGNVVIPVKENREKGHCKKLKELFDMTPVVSWQLYEFALGGQTFLFNRAEFMKLDAKLPDLELIEGRNYPYSYSILGRLEQYLDSMDTHRIP